MNKKQLQDFRAEVDKAYERRKAEGEFDVNSRYMIFLLGNMRSLIDHAISTYPKGQHHDEKNPKNPKLVAKRGVQANKLPRGRNR